MNDSNTCISCNGTGLLRLNDAPAAQDCPWCGGSGER